MATAVEAAPATATAGAVTAMLAGSDAAGGMPMQPVLMLTDKAPSTEDGICARYDRPPHPPAQSGHATGGP